MPQVALRCRSLGLDVHWVSHALGNLSQELQIPVTADQGQASRDCHPMEGASPSIQAVLSQHLVSRPSDVMLKFSLALGPRFSETWASCWLEVK